ncbi:MAG: hypothetical protein ACREQP_07210 [Candidatus Binatia bacterium]
MEGASRKLGVLNGVKENRHFHFFGPFEERPELAMTPQRLAEGMLLILTSQKFS